MVMVPFLVLLATGNAGALYRCDGDRIARTSCCCPETESPPIPITAVVSGACCSIETAEAAPTEARVQTNGFENVKTFPAPVALFTHIAGRLSAPLVARGGARAPGAPIPPTLLALKTSFLI